MPDRGFETLKWLQLVALQIAPRGRKIYLPFDTVCFNHASDDRQCSSLVAWDMAAALDHDMKRSGSHDPLIQKYRGSKRKKQQKPQWRSFHNERIINLYRRLFPESLRYGIHLPVTSSSYLQVQKVLLQPVSQSNPPEVPRK